MTQSLSGGPRWSVDGRLFDNRHSVPARYLRLLNLDPPASTAVAPHESRGASVELNRNHYFMAGVVLLLLGVQLRIVDSYVLNEQSTRILTPQAASTGLMAVRPLIQSVSPSTQHKVVKPPEALGWALMSIGSVLILHALAMKGPGGDH
jgi:hypothetical protein